MDPLITRAIGDFSIIFAKQAILEGFGENFSASTASIYIALSAIHFGVKGFVGSELIRALQIDYSKIISSQEQENHILSIQLKIIVNILTTNTEYYSKLFTAVVLNPTYINLLEKVFYTYCEDISIVDSEKAVTKINSWVEEKTHKRISEIIHKSGLPNDTGLILINLIYFKSYWKKKFNHKEIFVSKFTLENGQCINTEFMNQKCIFRLHDDEENRFRLLIVEYRSDDIIGVFILPSEGITIKELITMLSVDQLKSCIDKSYSTIIKISLPKFKIQSRLSIKETLSYLGIQKMFEVTKNDLENICSDRLYVHDIIHSSTVEVDEKGGYWLLSLPISLNNEPAHPEREFCLNRPFIFIIWERNYGIPLFVNAIFNPTEQ